MRELLLVLALGGCASRERRISSLNLESLCLGRAMSAEMLLSSEMSAEQRREGAFRNYYEAFLDVKEQSQYVDCLRRRYALPWLHSDFRRGRRWLEASAAMAARNEGPSGRRIADVGEEFSGAVRRVTVTLVGGEKQVFETSVPAGSGLKELGDQVDEAVKQIQAIDQPADETPEQRRKRLGLPR